MQRDHQVALHSISPDEMVAPERTEYIRYNVLALLDEVHEALHEVGWKPWKRAGRDSLRREAFLSELADVHLFLMNLQLAAGLTPRELLDAIEAKIAENMRRQETGY